MKYNEFKENVLNWSGEKGIKEGSTPLDQIGKTQEELTETRDALVECETMSISPEEHPTLGVKDGIGDIFTTLVILADLCGMDLEECAEHAWNEIKDRKGKMINGLFVKDGKEGK